MKLVQKKSQCDYYNVESYSYAKNIRQFCAHEINNFSVFVLVAWY